MGLVSCLRTFEESSHGRGVDAASVVAFAAALWDPTSLFAPEQTGFFRLDVMRDYPTVFELDFRNKSQLCVLFSLVYIYFLI